MNCGGDYDAAARTLVNAFTRIPKGDTIEKIPSAASSHGARYILDKTGAIA